jgi:exportin-T
MESAFLVNKFAQVVALLCLTDFPARRWDSFFHDFMRLCNNERSFTIFLKMLQQVNQDIADREFSKTQKEMEKGTLIKDIMRDVVMMDLSSFWFNIIELYRESCPLLVCLCLEVIGNYVAWIDISLVTNEAFMSRLFSMFDKKEFRCSVCDCFSGILHKGMDPLAKTTLIQQFVNVPAIKERLESIVSERSHDIDADFLVKLAKLINTIGVELIEAFKKTKGKSSAQNDTSQQQHLSLMSQAIESKFPLFCFFLSFSPLVSIQVHPFSREYIQWIKKQEVPEAKTLEVIKVFIQVIVDQSRYPNNYDFSVEDSNPEFEECRKSCRILFDNIMYLNMSSCVEIVCNDLLTPLLSGKASPSDQSSSQVEVSLYMLFLLGENLNVLLSNHIKRMEDILTLVITSNVSSFPHSSVQSIYFDIITRYDKVFAQTLTHLIPQLLVSFLDERGFKNSDSSIRSKVCNLFNKFIKSNIIKGKAADKINSFAEEIIKRLQDLLILDLSSNPSNGRVINSGQLIIPSSNFIPTSPSKTVKSTSAILSEEDQLVLYETIATLIISNSNYEVVKKHLLLKSFLIEPLWKAFDDLYSTLVSTLVMSNGVPTTISNGFTTKADPARVSFICERMTHCIFLVTRTSKAFSNVHPIKSINGQAIYLDSFNNFVKVLSLNVGRDNVFLLQSALRQLLHRLIVCLEEAEIVPLLPLAIEQIFLPSLVPKGGIPVTTSTNSCVIPSSSSIGLKTIQELIPLINQVVPKFKNSWMFQRDILPFLRQIFLPVVSSIFSLTSSNSGEDSLSPDEIHSLQKSYYCFLHVLATNNVMEVFTSLGMLHLFFGP